MPKTDVNKHESEDLAELSDEALDRADGNVQACIATACGYGASAPSD